MPKNNKFSHNKIEIDGKKKIKGMTNIRKKKTRIQIK
jgi:hypothetical protein